MDNFFSLASPLLDLPGQAEPDKVWWTQEAEQAFQGLKTTLTSLLVLRDPNFYLPFLMHMDTLEMGL